MASTVIIRNNLYNYDIVAMVYDERWGLFKKLFEVGNKSKRVNW